MGTPKALLAWHGLRLVRYQVEQLLAAGCETVVVVTGFAHAEVSAALADSHCIIAYNPEFEAGRAGSVRTGIAALPAGILRLAVLNVDQPRPSEVTRRLLAAQQQDNSAIAVPAYAGKRGHPLVVSAPLIPELGRVREETEGIREVVRRHEPERLVVEFDSAAVLLDLNTPEAYERAIRAEAGLRTDP